MPRLKIIIQALYRLSPTKVFLLAWPFCPFVWASQEAIVLAEKAIIYSDKTMSSPVGYLPRGKKVRVGEVPRNRAQLYPIIISGKVAYIRTIDVSTEVDSLESNRLVAERFQKIARKKIEGQYALSAFTYVTQISLEDENDQLENNGPFTWNGIQLKGMAIASPSWDFGVVIGYAEGKEYVEAFRMMEFGIAGAYRIYSGSNFIFRWETQLLAVPFASYSLGSKYRVNGYGYTAGTGLNLNWNFGRTWGLEVFGGIYQTGLFGFDVPAPYKSISPSFAGSRLGLGITHLY